MTTLREELQSATAEKMAAAAIKRIHPQKNYVRQTISERARKPVENMAKKIEEDAAAMVKVAGNLHNSITSVELGREAVQLCQKEIEDAKGGRPWDSLRYMAADP